MVELTAELVFGGQS